MADITAPPPLFIVMEVNVECESVRVAEKEGSPLEEEKERKE